MALTTPASGSVPSKPTRGARCNAILVLWAALMCCVSAGALLPATSPVMTAVGRLHVSDKVLHFSAYLALSLLPVIGFRDRRRRRELSAMWRRAPNGFALCLRPRR